MSLFQQGSFSFSSGQRSTWKVECDQLNKEDWAVLAELAVAILKPFGSVYPVLRGGTPFAIALEPYVTNGPVLVVDDVYTTGASMERTGMAVTQLSGKAPLGIVAFARAHYIPRWIRAVWALGACEL